MDMQTGSADDLASPPQNFSVFAHSAASRAPTSASCSFHKESSSYQAPGRPPTQSSYDRNLGIEYNLASANNLWTGKVGSMKSLFQSEPEQRRRLRRPLAVLQPPLAISAESGER